MTAGTATASVELARMVAGIGGPVGVTVDGRAARADAGEYLAFRWGLAPAGLATRRQLSACGLRPGGQDPVARIEWRRGRRFAELYAVAAAKPKRPMTPGKWAAVAAATRARRICPTCGCDIGYVLPRHRPECWDCQHDTAAAATTAA